MYQGLGHHDKALVVNLEALEQNPMSAARHALVIGSYILLNRFQEAQALAEEATIRGEPVESCKLRYFNSFEFFDHTGSGRLGSSPSLSSRRKPSSVWHRLDPPRRKCYNTYNNYVVKGEPHR
jgi:hypothetical protein